MRLMDDVDGGERCDNKTVDIDNSMVGCKGEVEESFCEKLEAMRLWIGKGERLVG